MLTNKLAEMINLNENLTVFIDMDGVLAKYDRYAYDKNNGPEPGIALFEHKNSHYFRHCTPDNNAIEILNMLLSQNNIAVFILTTVADHIQWAIDDKTQWLNQHCPKIDPTSQLITASSDKTEIIKAIRKTKTLDSSMILIDDFNKNLMQWASSGGTAIKYLNGINSPESWTGLKI